MAVVMRARLVVGARRPPVSVLVAVVDRAGHGRGAPRRFGPGRESNPEDQSRSSYPSKRESHH